MHIGKSSVGWRFLFRAYGYEGPGTYKEWINEIKNPQKHIRDEYGNVIHYEEFIKKIENMQKLKNHNEEKYNYKDKDGYDFLLLVFS